jgi:hypothetical protein
MTSTDSVYDLLTSLHKKIFNTIRQNQEGEMSYDDYINQLADVEGDEVNRFIDTCGNTKQFVEQYGVFYALKTYEECGYNIDLYKSEEKFYDTLLWVILTQTEESHLSSSYENYLKHCEENPLGEGEEA